MMAGEEERRTRINLIEDNQVWYSAERVVSSESSKWLARYESIHFTAGEKRTVKPGEDAEEVRDEIAHRVMNKIDEESSKWID